MPKQVVFHKDVDFSVLSEKEKKTRASRELFTIFYLAENRGLTDMDIYNWARWLNMSGYGGIQPDAIVRSNIYRWNDMAISAVTGGKKCDKCKKICSWGYEKEDPLRCFKHREPDMTKVIEERLVRSDKLVGMSKGKFFLDEKFAARVWKDQPNFQADEENKEIAVEKVETSSAFPDDPDVDINNMFAELDKFDDIYSTGGGASRTAETGKTEPPIMTFEDLEKFLTTKQKDPTVPFDTEQLGYQEVQEFENQDYMFVDPPVQKQDQEDDFFENFMKGMDDPLNMNIPAFGNPLFYGININF